MAAIISRANLVVNGVTIVETKQLAKDIFQEYDTRSKNLIQSYTSLKTHFPLNKFPKQAAAVWRSMMLMVVWGEIATKLSGGKVDYLGNWRAGK